MFKMFYLAVPVIQSRSIKLVFNYYFTGASDISSVWACNKVCNFKTSLMYVFLSFKRR